MMIWNTIWQLISVVVSARILQTEQSLFYICTLEKLPQVPKDAHVRKVSVAISFE